MARSIFPDGVIQVLGGDNNLPPALVAHPDIHKISFTGSIGTGKRIMVEASKTMKRITLELYVYSLLCLASNKIPDCPFSGGNDPTIILPD